MKNFNLIYSENHKIVLSFITMKIQNQVVAEELTNDVFMRVHKHLENYDSEKSTIKTWVINIAKNIVIDYYRKVKLNSISMDAPLDDNTYTIKDTMSSGSNPHKEMVTSETISCIIDGIVSLDKKYQTVAELFFIDQLSYEEISKKAQLPLSTVKVQILRARKQLVEQLEVLKV